MNISEQQFRITHVLKHLIRKDKIEAPIGKRQLSSIEGDKVSVGPGAFTDLRRITDVSADPANAGLDLPEEVDRRPCSAAEVKHTERLIGGLIKLRAPTRSRDLSKRLTSMVVGQTRAQLTN